MNTPKISICISVHNTDAYLPRCLDSILEQTFQDYEIVLVNNGSTDSSEDIMRAYQKNNPDKLIHIFEQEDRGLAQGRQTGIDHANGEYITFLDADDYVLPTAYEKINDAIEKSQADIIEIETLRGETIISSPFTGQVDAKTVLREYFSYVNIPTMLWLRTYKRELFAIDVLPKIYINNEDNFALPCLLFRAKSVVFIKEPLHVYSMDNERSVMFKLSQDTSLYMKLYNNKKKVLQQVSHIQQYIGAEAISKMFDREFHMFMSVVATNFLFFLPDKINFETKIKDAVEVLPVDDKDELRHIIEHFIPNTCIIYKLIRMMGIVNAYKIFTFFEYLKRKTGGNK